MNNRMVAAAIVVLTVRCTSPPTATQQHVIDVLCAGDAMAQPVVVPIVVAVAPGGAIAGVVDTALVHPAVVKACAKYGSKPAEVVPEAPRGARVVEPVVIKPGATEENDG